MRFDGKTAIVTGAGSGFGEAIASRFAREGARVVVADVNEENGRRVASAIAGEGGTARFVRTDVSRSAEVKAMIDLALSAFGGLDVLVNNAGFSHRTMPLWELPEEEYERVFATKGAVVTLTRGLAIEVAPFKIRVNAVNPVAAETGFMKGAVGVDKLPDEIRRQLVSTIPLGRLTEPRDVAAAVLFLASSDAEFLTGVCLAVDGGRSI